MTASPRRGQEIRNASHLSTINRSASVSFAAAAAAAAAVIAAAAKEKKEQNEFRERTR